MVSGVSVAVVIELRLDAALAWFLAVFVALTRRKRKTRKLAPSLHTLPETETYVANEHVHGAVSLRAGLRKVE